MLTALRSTWPLLHATTTTGQPNYALRAEAFVVGMALELAGTDEQGDPADEVALNVLGDAALRASHVAAGCGRELTGPELFGYGGDG